MEMEEIFSKSTYSWGSNRFKIFLETVQNQDKYCWIIVANIHLQPVAERHFCNKLEENVLTITSARTLLLVTATMKRSTLKEDNDDLTFVDGSIKISKWPRCVEKCQHSFIACRKFTITVYSKQDKTLKTCSGVRIIYCDGI